MHSVPVPLRLQRSAATTSLVVNIAAALLMSLKQTWHGSGMTLVVKIAIGKRMMSFVKSTACQKNPSKNWLV